MGLTAKNVLNIKLEMQRRDKAPPQASNLGGRRVQAMVQSTAHQSAEQEPHFSERRFVPPVKPFVEDSKSIINKPAQDHKNAFMSPGEPREPCLSKPVSNLIAHNQNYISNQLNAIRNERIQKYGSSKVPTPIRPSAKSSPGNSYLYQQPHPCMMHEDDELSQAVGPDPVYQVNP